NPTAAILSAAMLLRHSFDDEAGASQLERAVERAYAAGARTAELAGDGRVLSTHEFADAVAAQL
ncbi:MAG TPA: isocitrate/isopropylmalate family dehydrogenase, partial [Candidatus Tumulicola sp.]|nr:isocitrate/isopropylmalate family dehydrogenase [Candidatus Tumulicola sp.]